MTHFTLLKCFILLVTNDYRIFNYLRDDLFFAFRDHFNVAKIQYIHTEEPCTVLFAILNFSYWKKF